MRREAKDHEEEDTRRKNLVDAKNQGDSLSYEIERQIKEFGDKLTDQQKSDCNLEIGRLREALKGEDLHEIKSATEALQESWHKIARELYSQQGGEAGAHGPEQARPGFGGGFDPKGAAPNADAKQGSKSDGEQVIDAEVEN